MKLTSGPILQSFGEPQGMQMRIRAGCQSDSLLAERFWAALSHCGHCGIFALACGPYERQNPSAFTGRGFVGSAAAILAGQVMPDAREGAHGRFFAGCYLRSGVLQCERDQFRGKVGSPRRDHEILFALVHIGHGRRGRVVRQCQFADALPRVFSRCHFARMSFGLSGKHRQCACCRLASTLPNLAGRERKMRVDLRSRVQSLLRGFET
jgi:hypothetical protein